MASIETVETMIRKRRLRWLGHVARMEPDRIPGQLLLQVNRRRALSRWSEAALGRCCDEGCEEV